MDDLTTVTHQRRGLVARVALISLCVAGGLIAGLSAASGEPDAPMRWEELPVLGAVARYDLDGVAEVVSATQQRLRIDTEQCLAHRGAPVQLAVEPDLEAAITRMIAARPMSLVEATDRGLRAVAGFEGSGGEASSSHRSDVSQELFEACTVEATAPFLERPNTLVGDLASSYRAEVLTDSQVASARTSWRACITGRGLDIHHGAAALDSLYPALAAALADVDDRGVPTEESLDELWSLEREAALSIAVCDRSAYAPVLEHWVALETAWANEHADALDLLDPQLLLQWAAIVQV